jgi:hypothetical protein
MNTPSMNTQLMNTVMNTTPSMHTGGVRVVLDHDLAEDLHWAVGLVEDWLLHASPEALDELAQFAYGPAHRGPDQLRWFIDLLGEAAVRLRPPPQPPNRLATPEPATAERGPSR